MLEEIILVDDCNVKVRCKLGSQSASHLLSRVQDARFQQQMKDINAFIAENPKVNLPIATDTDPPRHPSARWK